MCRVAMDQREVYCVCECGLSQTVMDISAALTWCVNEGLRHGIGATLRMEIVLAVDVKTLPGLVGGGTGPKIV